VAVSLAVKCFVTGLASEAGQSHLDPRSAQDAELGGGTGPTCCGGDGWESNPPGTAQHRPTDGFEDRGKHQPPNIPGALSLPHVGRPFFKALEGLALTRNRLFGAGFGRFSGMGSRVARGGRGGRKTAERRPRSLESSKTAGVAPARPNKRGMALGDVCGRPRKAATPCPGRLTGNGSQ